MRVGGDKLVFDSGKVKSANCGIVGLSPEGDVSGGYDNDVWYSGMAKDWGYDTDEVLTPAERIELARYMIERWTEFMKIAKSEMG